MARMWWFWGLIQAAALGVAAGSCLLIAGVLGVVEDANTVPAPRSTFNWEYATPEEERAYQVKQLSDLMDAERMSAAR